MRLGRSSASHISLAERANLDNGPITMCADKCVGNSARLSVLGGRTHLWRMDEVGEFKEFLGPAAKGYSQTQLRQLNYEMRLMAELLLDLHLEKQSARNAKDGFDADIGSPYDEGKVETK